MADQIRQPLPERLRPDSLNLIAGQQHLLGEGKPLRMLFESGKLYSFILWGPPGTGKTTIAKLAAASSGYIFYQLNAVSSGVKDIRDILEKAVDNRRQGKGTILFIDEIHRFNKAQQDALLNPVEQGIIILIGATTENPSFEVIPALRSRMRIFMLHSLSEEELRFILHRAVKEDSLITGSKITLADEDYLLFVSGGDARTLLNLLESSAEYAVHEGKTEITQQIIENVLQQKNTLYDKSGEGHYNLISAFIKSMRGSDPDAALYWMARMIEGGEDPLFIARRMIVFASEDIGNASPSALLLAVACFQALEKIGMPEGRIVMAQTVTYLASASKSNASYLGIEKAAESVRRTGDKPVPFHLRNGVTQYMKSEGYGKGYRYPHDFPNGFILEDYLPKDLIGSQFYFPKEEGQEKSLKDRLKALWKGKKRYE
ncbi:MAG: Replication-associated recombination protein A [Ignavibacteriaceae bacterium]|nr:Replication-associated recombination protein A [Ignavibacteriaceae bacterium]